MRHGKIAVSVSPALKREPAFITVRFSKQAPVDTILNLTLDSEAMAIQPIDTETSGRRSLSNDAQMTASSNGGTFANNPACLVHHAWEQGGAILQFGQPGYEEQRAVLAKKPDTNQYGYGMCAQSGLQIGHPFRYWQAKPDDAAPQVELDLCAGKTFSEVCLAECYGYTEAFFCDAWIEGAWKTLFTDKELGFYNRRLDKPITASKLRIRFLKSNGPPSLFSVMLY